MDALTYDLKELCMRNPHGSRSTQATRLRQLNLIASQFSEAGFKLPSARSLKPKHIEAVLAGWKGQGLATSTIKNRIAAIRWWAKSVNKSSILETNEEYGLEAKELNNENKGKRLDLEKLEQVESPHVKMALRLQAAFGLRREEAIKFNPEISDLGDRIALKPSTTKGGRYREIEITTDKQRDLLEEAKEVAEGGSLIPDGTSYKEQMKLYENQTLKAGLKNNHGLRHNYAQWKYKQLTGWAAPAVGGKKRKDMTADEWKIDREARRDISEELGHSRIDVTDTYLGSATK